MTVRRRLVIDTNVLVSFALLSNTTPRRAVEFALRNDLLLISDATLTELRRVLLRSKFDRYATRAERQSFLLLLERIAIHVDIIEHVQACSDPDDDKFIEAAVNGDAEFLITGDAALLALGRFRGIEIITPAIYLAHLPQI